MRVEASVYSERFGAVIYNLLVVGGALRSCRVGVGGKDVEEMSKFVEYRQIGFELALLAKSRAANIIGVAPGTPSLVMPARCVFCVVSMSRASEKNFFGLLRSAKTVLKLVPPEVRKRSQFVSFFNAFAISFRSNRNCFQSPPD